MLPIFPHPTTGKRFTVQLPEAVADGRVQLVDAVGRVVWQRTLTGAALDVTVAELPAGVYQLVVSWPNAPVSAQQVVLGE